MRNEIDISPLAIAELKDIFRSAQAEITMLLANYIESGTPGYELGRQRVLLKQVNEILEGMDEPALQWIEHWLPDSYSRGTLYATRTLREIGLDLGELKSGFAVIEENQILALAESMVIDLDSAQASILHKFDLAIKASRLDMVADLEATRQTAIGLVKGEGVRGIQERLLDKVLTGKIAPGAYKGSLEAYAEMLARTRIAEAQTAGMIARTSNYGCDLVKVTAHGGSCPLCEPLQGMVFSISGTDPTFPALAQVGPPPWHPNCVHRLVPFVAELASASEYNAALTASRRAA